MVKEMDHDSPLVGQLEVGDRIVTNNGRRVSDLGDLRAGGGRGASLRDNPEGGQRRGC